jgi:hypothetical protein
VFAGGKHLAGGEHVLPRLDEQRLEVVNILGTSFACVRHDGLILSLD